VLHRLLEALVAFFRKDKNYKLDSRYSLVDILLILKYRCMQLLRGLYIKVFIKSEGSVFCGRSVTVEYGYNIRAGASLILDDYVSINALSTNGVVFGRNVSIGKGTIIVCTGVIKNKGVGLCMGDYSSVGAQSFLGCQGGVKIGSNVIIGPSFKVFSENHKYDDKIAIRLQGEVRKGVRVGDDCWFGANVTLLDGVTVGDGCVIAAGSVVNKSVLPGSIIAGVPAKLVKRRFS